MIKGILPLLLLGATACGGGGVGFQIGDQKKRDEEAAKTRYEFEPKPLVVTSEAEPNLYNEALAANVSKLEASYDFRPDAATEVSLWITKFKQEKCGDLDGVEATFRWNVVQADGSLGEATVVQPQEWHRVEAGETQRVTARVQSSYGTCQRVWLQFEAHTRGL